ncbi:hypothetical protein A3D00_01800 [Candidatus Woesebacteria bacterium RIFCSPHIGHO2_02_FULL_38_9]|uniref:GlcNAc-PI de-N-acetylase n=1 Tax=Candidatus Woesebacteria bacterium RIFCSPHIGHO2_01_FULL_39_28 TaxID=1802496 RepID=A0A1F7YG27_9BACT|nr:MAG: hypothetical protein A2627_03655 [Candidatus Woesebacteria bacterium RIFCSPHIGHO2_01_FULL_39_28]OGM33661.1 MAG: hypothetical protein A3D00_01800 [Candidatus Woesebacteria bacterium RIFCSPHIGHO2_02_FULL_38_9]OGM58518.1 MAG: hypothetical protein A3A50_00665 [Candidatus Woesebacteria bacterium RIFCSPLOWO2_01_FULL_38_20]
MILEKFDISQLKNKKILAFGAHPDDIEFGAGGTLAQFSGQNSVEIIIATDGGLGTHDQKLKNGDISKIRKKEAESAAELLGFKNINFWNFPDGGLRAWDKKLRQKIVKTLINKKPDIIFSFDPWVRYEPGLHPDHRTLAWAVAETWLLVDTPLFLKKMRHENVVPLNPKPALWLYAPAEANWAVDITHVWENKVEALEYHQSQFPKEKMEKIKNKLESRFSEAGKQIGVPLAEPFRILE